MQIRLSVRNAKRLAQLAKKHSTTPTMLANFLIAVGLSAPALKIKP